MDFFGRLFGIKDKQKSENEIDAIIAKAQEALRNRNFDYCITLIQQANINYSSREEKTYLFGLYRSAPSAPLGIAGLADYAILYTKNVEFTLNLLDYIGKNVGTGPCLSEVWFSLYQVALEQRKYEFARIAFLGCLQCQYNTSGIFRIDKELLLKTAKDMSVKYLDDLTRAAELTYFLVMMQKQ